MVLFPHRPKTGAPENPETLVTRETTICTITNNIISLSVRISSYLPSTKRQITLRVRSLSVNARPDYGTFFFLPPWRLYFTDGS